MTDSSFKASNQTVDISPIKNKQTNSNITNKKSIEAISNSTIKDNKSVKSPSPVKRNGNNSSNKGSINDFASLNREPISGIALGLIETRGLVPAIEAADAMTKAAEVQLVAREFVGGGYVTVMVRGETGAVNASVRAGADACERVGDGLIAAHIIARPHTEIEPVLQGSGAKRRS